MRQFTPDEIVVINERRHGWEKASCATLARIFGTTPQKIAAITRASGCAEQASDVLNGRAGHTFPADGANAPAPSVNLPEPVQPSASQAGSGFSFSINASTLPDFSTENHGPLGPVPNGNDKKG